MDSLTMGPPQERFSVVPPADYLQGMSAGEAYRALGVSPPDTALWAPGDYAMGLRAGYLGPHARQLWATRH